MTEITFLTTPQPSMGVLQIHLDILQKNWVFFQSAAKHSVCGAVVKANAYGLGLAPVVQALYGAGCRVYFVVTLEEALAVKSQLSYDVDIYVMQGCEPGTEHQFIAANIIPVIITLSMLKRWMTAIGKSSARVALKINTGMNRFGLSIQEFYRLADDTQVFGSLCIEVLFSHLACANEPDHPMNLLQLTEFQKALAFLRCYYPQVKGSLANSAGILLGYPWQFDLVRPGIGLYGGQPQLKSHPGIGVVARLYLSVLQVRCLNVGDAVGYGCDFVAQQAMKVILVRGGYADGVPRHLSNCGKGWFNRDLPLLGRVSMDSCVFDISHLPSHLEPQEGDWIEILGEHIVVDDLASTAKTISYEIFTGLGSRLQKEYVNQVIQESL